MRSSIVTLFAVMVVTTSGSLLAQTAGVPTPSPENIVYQYLATKTFTLPKFETPPGVPVGNLFQPQSATGYLWVPPACKQVKGILVLGANVPEQWLGGHPAIRQVCTEQDLAIVFTCPSFRLSNINAADNRLLTEARKARYNIGFLQDILDELAAKSGYAELSTVPWFPVGESMSLQIVSQLTQFAPERCIAGVWVKDAQWSRVTTAVPMLGACGTGAEWDFPKFDVFERWREMAREDMQGCVAKRTSMPGWPGSLIVEAGSAHFSCTEAMIRLIGQYIRAACQARLSADGTPVLRPVDLNSGFVAGLPVPGSAPVKPKRYADCTPAERNLPWYFDRDLAQAACDLANINWNAKTQVPVFVDDGGKVVPFNRRGITDLTPKLEADGITFTVKATLLDNLPGAFVKGGSPLTHVTGPPAVEWLKGPAIPLGNNRFQLALDRSGSGNNEQTLFLRVIHPGDASYHLSVHPASVHISANLAGKPQTITFDPIPDQTADRKEIMLHAISDAGLPVRFFVKAGPAVIHGDKLIFTSIPVKSRMPIAVTVAAWQWGRATEPAIQTAVTVERTFLLADPKLVKVKVTPKDAGVSIASVLCLETDAGGR